MLSRLEVMSSQRHYTRLFWCKKKTDYNSKLYEFIIIEHIFRSLKKAYNSFALLENIIWIWLFMLSISLRISMAVI